MYVEDGEMGGEVGGEMVEMGEDLMGVLDDVDEELGV